jgi:hypothetical protein
MVQNNSDSNRFSGRLTAAAEAARHVTSTISDIDANRSIIQG